MLIVGTAQKGGIGYVRFPWTRHVSASEGERSRFRHISVITLPFFLVSVDYKTVRIFAYSSTHEQSNKRSGTRLKTESETRERRFFFLSPHMPYGRVRLARFARIRLFHHALLISLLILRKTRLFCSVLFSLRFR